MNNDLISREALKEALKSNCKPELCHDYNTAWCESCCHHNDFEDLIDNAPTVEERPKGEWLKAINEFFNWECSLCHKPHDFKDNYCPNCGAKMKGGKE